MRFRDEDHKPLPGITVGDVGSKFGFNMKDNGYLGFDHFRIPRANLLAKYTKLSRAGEFTVEGNPRIMYAVMLAMRILFLNECLYMTSISLTIGLRYALVRTQFSDKEGTEKERPIMEY